MTHVAIVGGGIAGLSAAYFLSKAGLTVTVIDKGNLDDSASIGNAGFLSMFEKSPFAYPGVFRDTARAYLKKRTPMIINSAFDTDLWHWGYRFFQASKERKYKKTLAILEHFGEEVFSFYKTLTEADKIDCEYERRGFALVYTDPETYRKKLAAIPAGSPHVEILSREKIAETFPFIREEKIVGAIVLRRNGNIHPGKVISGLKNFLEQHGVKFRLNCEITRFETADARAKSVCTAHDATEADEFIIATGAEKQLARGLGTRLVMTPGKGYSLTFSMDPSLKPKLPALFSDIYTAVTPRHDDVRITGKIEFGPSRADPRARAESLLQVLKTYTKEFSIETKNVWSGNRPLTSDDMPYLGRDKTFGNVLYLTGLGHTGMNIGPIGARIVSELIVKQQRNVENTELLLLSGFYQN